MTKIDDPFIKILPQLDLHGEDTMTSLVLVNEFINDKIKKQKDSINSWKRHRNTKKSNTWVFKKWQKSVRI